MCFHPKRLLEKFFDGRLAKAGADKLRIFFLMAQNNKQGPIFRRPRS
jgi:hypothetical protein